MLRLLRTLLFTLLAVLVLAVGAVSFLTTTDAGSRWLLRQALDLTPGELQVARIHGRLVTGLTLESVDYSLDQTAVQIDRLVLRWQPADLLRGALRIHRLQLDDLRITTGPASPQQEPAAIPERIPMPLVVIVEELRIEGLRFGDPEQPTRIDRVELAARAGPLQGLVVERLAVSMQGNSVELNGQADLHRPYAFSAAADWRASLPDELQAAGHARLEGDLSAIQLQHSLSQPVQVTTRGSVRLDAPAPLLFLRGQWQELQWPLTGEAEYRSAHGEYRFEGTLADYRLELSGPLSGSNLPEARVQARGHGDGTQIHVDSLLLDTLGGTASASGNVAWQPDFSLALNIEGRQLEPGRQWPVGAGRLDLNTRLTIDSDTRGTRVMLNQLDVRGQLHGQALVARGALGFDNGTPTTPGLTLESGANRVKLVGALDQAGLQLDLDAPQLATLLPGAAGQLQADGVLTGPLQQPAARLTLSGENLAYAGNQVGKLAASVDLGVAPSHQNSLQLDVHDMLIGASPVEQLSLRGDGSLASHRLRLDVSAPQAGVRLEAAGGYDSATWKGNLETATLSPAQGDAWQLREAVELHISTSQAQPFAACWSSSQQREICLQGEWQNTRARLQVRADSQEGQAEGGVAIRDLTGPRPALQGEVDARIPDIRFLDGLVPGMRISGGTVAASAQLGGYLDAPTISGTAELSDGTLAVADLGLTISDIGLEARGDGQRLSLRGAARSGEGSVQLVGQLDLDPQRQWPFTASLQGERFTVSQLPDLEMTASPDLAVAGSLQGAEVTGKVLIPRARIRLKKLPPNVVKVSPDQVIVGSDAAAGAQEPTGFPLTLNVVVLLGDDVHFEGLGLTTNLAGTLNLRSLRNDSLIGNGVLELRDGRYEGYGQKLAIERGRLLFAGPLNNPALDVRATRKAGSVVAGIELYGSADAPQTRLFSDPAMSDAEALSYLVTGKPLGASSTGGEAQALAAAAASLGANSPVAQEISQSLGVEIGVQSGESDSATSLVVSKQLSSRLSVDYVYGLFTETAAIQFIYELTDQFSLTGQSGTVQAIDLHYNINVP